MPVAKQNTILVVGAGFAGAVYARKLAEAGYEVDIIDKRDHIAGNAFDFVDQNGIRVHRYGPHLFHTKNARVVDWLRGFGEWVPYVHRVRAVLEDGRFVPLPVNLDTINAVFGTTLTSKEDVVAFLAKVAEPIANPRNAGEYLNSRIGRRLTDPSSVRTRRRCGCSTSRTWTIPSSGASRCATTRRIVTSLTTRSR